MKKQIDHVLITKLDENSFTMSLSEQFLSEFLLEGAFDPAIEGERQPLRMAFSMDFDPPLFYFGTRGEHTMEEMKFHHQVGGIMVSEESELIKKLYDWFDDHYGAENNMFSTDLEPIVLDMKLDCFVWRMEDFNIF